MLKNVTYYIEERIPAHWSPNVITWIGNAGPFASALLCFYYGGLKLHGDAPVPPNWVFIFAAFSI